jgi:GNAT superfamily N-acetyltransferase
VTSATVRLGIVGDIPVLQQIESRASKSFASIGMLGIASDEPSSAEVLQDRISTEQLLVVQLAAPVGFVYFKVVEKYAYIEEISVDPDHAGHRYAALLLDAIARTASSFAFEALLLSTFKSVPWNAPYYRRLGFIEIPDAKMSSSMFGIRQEHANRGLDESKRVFMQKSLRI